MRGKTRRLSNFASSLNGFFTKERVVGREKMSRRRNGGRERRRHGRGDGVSNRQREERLERGDQARMRQTHRPREGDSPRQGRQTQETRRQAVAGRTRVRETQRPSSTEKRDLIRTSIWTGCW